MTSRELLKSTMTEVNLLYQELALQERRSFLTSAKECRQVGADKSTVLFLVNVKKSWKHNNMAVLGLLERFSGIKYN